MLGHKLLQVLKEKHEVWVTVRGLFSEYESHAIFDPLRTIENVNVEDIKSVRQAIEKSAPQLVINAIGVIKQLPSSNNIIYTLNVNSIFPHKLEELSYQYGFRLICVSTDCVFNGQKGNYNEDDYPDATDLYGKSKNLGEVISDNCLTLRSSIIGRELGTAHSLLEWFLSNRGKSVKGYVNALYSGFPTIVFANIIADIIENQEKLSGLYHVSSDPINKFDLLNLIRSKFDLDIDIDPYEDFKIDRSLDSTLFRDATGFSPMPWDEMIKEMANDPTVYDK